MWYLINRFLKRFFDIVICSVAMIILIPVWIIVAIAIKCDSKGPVFFVQERLTKDGRRLHDDKFYTGHYRAKTA